MKYLNLCRSFPPVKGTIARVAINCDCPDTGITGDFLYTGESHRTKGSRVSPVYDDLFELFPAVLTDWEEIIPGNCSFGYSKR